MRQLQIARIQRPDDPERFSDHDIFCIFPPNLGLQSVYNPCVMQSLHTLRQGPLQNEVERVFIIVGLKDFGLGFSGISECPSVLEKCALLEDSASTSDSTSGG